MNATPLSSNQRINSTQPSILGFVDCPNYNTAKARLPHLEKRSPKDSLHPQGSSSHSTSQKCKSSSNHPSNYTAKKLNMEVDNNNHVKEDNTPFISPLPTPTPQLPLDPYTAALLEMEARLTRTMKEMLEPLKQI